MKIQNIFYSALESFTKRYGRILTYPIPCSPRNYLVWTKEPKVNECCNPYLFIRSSCSLSKINGLDHRVAAITLCRRAYCLLLSAEQNPIWAKMLSGVSGPLPQARWVPARTSFKERTIRCFLIQCLLFLFTYLHSCQTCMGRQANTLTKTRQVFSLFGISKGLLFCPLNTPNKDTFKANERATIELLLLENESRFARCFLRRRVNTWKNKRKPCWVSARILLA